MSSFRRKVNESFHFENALDTRDSHDNFNKNILLNFIHKIVIKGWHVKFDAFSTEHGLLIFSSKVDTQKSKIYNLFTV